MVVRCNSVYPLWTFAEVNYSFNSLLEFRTCKNLYTIFPLSVATLFVSSICCVGFRGPFVKQYRNSGNNPDSLSVRRWWMVAGDAGLTCDAWFKSLVLGCDASEKPPLSSSTRTYCIVFLLVYRKPLPFVYVSHLTVDEFWILYYLYWVDRTFLILYRYLCLCIDCIPDMRCP